MSLWWFWHARATQPTEECGKSTQARVQIYTRSRDGQEEKNKRKKKKKKRERKGRIEEMMVLYHPERREMFTVLISVIG